jgi:hypothetical protein
MLSNRFAVRCAIISYTVSIGCTILAMGDNGNFKAIFTHRDDGLCEITRQRSGDMITYVAYFRTNHKNSTQAMVVKHCVYRSSTVNAKTLSADFDVYDQLYWQNYSQRVGQ